MTMTVPPKTDERAPDVERPVPQDFRPYVVSRGKRWVALAALLTVGLTVAGALLGGSRPPTYAAETRLTVGATSLGAFSVPGYVVATEALASNYARYVNASQAGLAETAQAAGVDPALIESVAASPIPDSNVLRIEVTGPSARAATTLADALAAGLVAEVARPDGPTAARLQSRLERRSRESAQRAQQVADAETTLADLQELFPGPNARLRPAVIAAKARLASLRSASEVLQVRQEVAAQDYRETFDDRAEDVAVQVIRPAFVASDTSAQTEQWGAAAGLVLGVGLGTVLLWSVWTRRKHAR